MSGQRVSGQELVRKSVEGLDLVDRVDLVDRMDLGRWNGPRGGPDPLPAVNSTSVDGLQPLRETRDRFPASPLRSTLILLRKAAARPRSWRLQSFHALRDPVFALRTLEPPHTLQVLPGDPGKLES